MVEPAHVSPVVLEQLPSLARVALAARFLLRFLPFYEPGPKTPLNRLAVGTAEAVAYRAALGLLSAEPTGHRAAAKTASAVFPKEPGRLLSEAVTAWEAGDPEEAGRLALQEAEHIGARAQGAAGEAFAEAEEEDVRFLRESGTAPDFHAFFARPLFSQAGEPQQPVAEWLAYLQELDLAETVGRRYQELMKGSFPERRLLLAILDAWASQLERLPEESDVLHSAADREPSQPARAPQAPDARAEAVGRFTALGEALAERDLLGRQFLVDALASMCADPTQGTPFTLALIGAWGAGKSTTMHLLRNKLSEAPYAGRFSFAWFNAWEYENTGNMAAGLAQEIVRGLLAGLGWRRKALVRVRFAIRRNRRGVISAVFRLLGAALLLPLSWLLLANAEPVVQSLLGVGVAAGLGAFALGLRRDIKQLWESPVTADLKTLLKLPDFGEHLGLLPVIKAQVRTLCDLRLGARRDGSRRLICFIDDLDRCRPESIVQTLEAVRLVMDEKDCIVVMGFDYRIALAAVADRYRSFETEGRTRQQIARDYLGKVVQLAIRLDEPDETSLQRFIAEQLFPQRHQEAAPGPAGLSASGSALEDAARPLERTAEAPATTSAMPLPASSPPVSGPVDLAKEMLHTVEEGALFGRLAAEHRFSNPRLLIRLRNSYRLLRLVEARLGLSPAGSRLPKALLMRAIFWQELLHQWPRDKRKELEAAVLGAPLPEGLPEPAGEVLRQVGSGFQKLLGNGGAASTAYRKAAALADMLVLPYGD